MYADGVGQGSDVEQAAFFRARNRLMKCGAHIANINITKAVSLSQFLRCFSSQTPVTFGVILCPREITDNLLETKHIMKNMNMNIVDAHFMIARHTDVFCFSFFFSSILFIFGCWRTVKLSDGGLFEADA